MKSLAELQAIRERMQNKVNLREGGEATTRIVVGMATCGIAAGARLVLAERVEEVQRRGLKGVSVSQTGCIGICQLEPVIEVFEAGKEKVTYIKITPEKARRGVAEHIVNGNVVSEYAIGTAEQDGGKAK